MNTDNKEQKTSTTDKAGVSFNPLLCDENFYQRLMVGEERHLIYTYKGKVYQSFKKWTFAQCEKVLTRLGATYWEIG